LPFIKILAISVLSFQHVDRSLGADEGAGTAANAAVKVDDGVKVPFDVALRAEGHDFLGAEIDAKAAGFAEL
jgi:hypothetical protein